MLMISERKGLKECVKNKIEEHKDYVKKERNRTTFSERRDEHKSLRLSGRKEKSSNPMLKRREREGNRNVTLKGQNVKQNRRAGGTKEKDV